MLNEYRDGNGLLYKEMYGPGESDTEGENGYIDDDFGYKIRNAWPSLRKRAPSDMVEEVALPNTHGHPTLMDIVTTLNDQDDGWRRDKIARLLERYGF